MVSSLNKKIPAEKKDNIYISKSWTFSIFIVFYVSAESDTVDCSIQETVNSFGFYDTSFFYIFFTLLPVPS